MPVSQLDPRSALIVVDLQKGLLHHPTITPIAQVIEKAGALAHAFRSRGLPVVLVNVAGISPGRAEQSFDFGELPADFLELATELDPQPEDHLVTKRSWGAFTATGLGDKLREAGVSQVVVAGMATSIGVESTARQAHELGFNVTLAYDAMTDFNPKAHKNSIEHIFPRLGEIGSAQDVIDRLS